MFHRIMLFDCMICVTHCQEYCWAVQENQSDQYGFKSKGQILCQFNFLSSPVFVALLSHWIFKFWKCHFIILVIISSVEPLCANDNTSVCKQQKKIYFVVAQKTLDKRNEQIFFPFYFALLWSIEKTEFSFFKSLKHCFCLFGLLSFLLLH